MPTAASALPPGTETAGGSGPIWLNNVECTYEDTRLIDCAGDKLGLSHSGHSLDVGVSCPGNYIYLECLSISMETAAILLHNHNASLWKLSN